MSAPSEMLDPVRVLLDAVPEDRRDQRRAEALSELSTMLADDLHDTGAVIGRMAKLIAAFIGDTISIRLLDEDNTTLRLVAVADLDPSAEKEMQRIIGTLPTTTDTLEQHAAAMVVGHPLALRGPSLDAVFAGLPPPALVRVESLGVHTLLLCPLRARGSILGTLAAWRRGPRGAHSERDRLFIQDCSDRLALAAANSTLLHRLEGKIEQTQREADNYRLSMELLQRAEEKRRVLLEHIVTAQEEERRRIAADVHDDSIQAMAALGLRLQTLRRRTEDPAAASGLADLEDTVTESIARLRDLLFRLEASSIDRAGLVRTIKRFVAEAFPDARPAVRVRSRLDAEPPYVTQIVLYRVAQEALTNVRKHAGASEVTVSLTSRSTGVALTVHDNGCGFDVDEVRSRTLPGHLGLRSMTERAELGGGTLTITSTATEGTRLECWLPLSADVTSTVPGGA